MRLKLQLSLLLLAPLSLAACGEETEDSASCPATLPQAATSCSADNCSATSGEKTYSQSTLDPDTSQSWMIVSWLGSDVELNEGQSLTYAQSTAGALTQSSGRIEKSLKSTARPALQARIAAEALIRNNGVTGFEPSEPMGTAIVNPDAGDKAGSCSAESPSCDGTQLCVIPYGEVSGSCASAQTIKWRAQDGTSNYTEVAATVRAVGTYGAIVVDDADTVSDEDISTLLTRFDEHIAPLDHAFFGQAEDFDQNGKTILFLTNRIGDIAAGNLVGFFQTTDLQDPSSVANSNGADMLYVRPPSSSISLNQLSATVGHEYQHLLNYCSKVIRNKSGQEETWLDEGLATFAEDMLGYGSDSFENVSAYLNAVGSTSLTGNNLAGDSDTSEQRGMAQLLIRYYFEQAGGASFSGASGLTDNGGVAAVRALVDSEDTGVDLFSDSRGGISGWLRDLLITVALDGTGYTGVSCNSTYQLGAPSVDSYTGYQRGIDLRTSIQSFSGATITLNGPQPLNAFAAGSSDLPMNGGEIFTLDTSAKNVLGVSAEAGWDVGMIAIPTALTQTEEEE